MTRYKKSKLKKRLTISASLTFLSILLICFFSQFNSLISLNYQIQDCKKQLKELTKTNENLKMNFVEANRIAQIEKAAQNLNFEKTQRVHYIEVIPEIVANK